MERNLYVDGHHCMKIRSLRDKILSFILKRCSCIEQMNQSGVSASSGQLSVRTRTLFQKPLGKTRGLGIFYKILCSCVGSSRLSSEYMFQDSICASSCGAGRSIASVELCALATHTHVPVEVTFLTPNFPVDSTTNAAWCFG